MRYPGSPRRTSPTGAAIDERFVWPIGYDDLVEYYELVEDDLRITVSDLEIPFVPRGRAAHVRRPPRDWEALARAAARHGHPIGAVPIAMGAPWMIALRPREFVSHQCIVRPLQRARNFDLRPAARVLRVDFDDRRGRATAVTYADLSTGRIERQEGSAFVIAAGPLDSTEILMRSRSAAFPTGLGNAFGALGRYLHDHPREWWPARPTRPLTALVHPMYIGREPYEPDRALLSTSLTIGLGSMRARLASMLNRRTYEFGVQTFGTTVPTDEVALTLDPTFQPDDPSSGLHLDIAFDERAVANVHHARQRFRDAFAAAGNPMEIGPFHELIPGTSVHLGGTARMHDQPEFGVVDGENRVHGAPNVVVCDASCFTTGPEKNPTLTAMAIAARAARRLAADLQ